MTTSIAGTTQLEEVTTLIVEPTDEPEEDYESFENTPPVDNVPTASSTTIETKIPSSSSTTTTTSTSTTTQPKVKITDSYFIKCKYYAAVLRYKTRIYLYILISR